MPDLDWDHPERGPVKRVLRRLIPLFVVLGLGAGAVLTLRSFDAVEATPYATASVPEGVTVTTSARPEIAESIGPFADTPAAEYPKGEAGITLPEAKAVTGFTAAEVRSALGEVRAALVAGRLDEKMLVDHDPQKFLKLLAPGNRTTIRAWFKENDYSSVATWIHPKTPLNRSEPPRVSGRITYASKKVDGLRTLSVTTNFVWVYAFTKGEPPVAGLHDEIVWEFTADSEDVEASARGLWLASAESYMTGIDCELIKTDMIAPAMNPDLGPPGTVVDPDAPLRTDHTLDIRSNCP